MAKGSFTIRQKEGVLALNATRTRPRSASSNSGKLNVLCRIRAIRLRHTLNKSPKTRTQARENNL